MYDIMPIRYFLNTKAPIYFWKFENNLIPAFFLNFCILIKKIFNI